MDSLLKNAQAALRWGCNQLSRWTATAASTAEESQLERALTTISRGEPLNQQLLDDIAQEIRQTALYLPTMSWPSLKSSPNAEQVSLENQCACLPLLRQAVDSHEEGSSEARLEYERRRLTHIDFLPSYARNLCEQTCQQECSKVKIKVPSGLANHELVKAEVATFVSRDIQGSGLDENGQPRPGPLKLSGFTGSFSYESAQLVLQALSPERRRDVFSVMIDGREGAITDRFSPASDGPLGTAASAAWRQMAKIALASVLLEDLLSVVPFQFPPEIKSEAISKVVAGTVSPWAIAESRLVKNARELSELYDAGKVSDQVLGTVIKSREAMFSSSIERVVDDIEYARASKARKVAAVQASDVASQTVTTTRSDAAIRIGNPKWEFYTAIHSARPDEAFDSGFRQQHAALYRIYRTTNISLQDCVDLVRKGSEAEARFVSELKEQQLLLPPRPESAASSAERVGATQADTSVELESCLDEPYTIEGQQALLASDWFKKLGPDYKKAIPERLRRVAEGNFGDWKRLQGVDACELRFEHGEGQRIYFRFTGPNSIELLDAGPKGEQKQILARIRQG